jgi:hypothetical protein
MTFERVLLVLAASIVTFFGLLGAFGNVTAWLG